MTIINQTASLSGMSNNFGLVIWMLIIGGVLIFIVWVISQLSKQ